VVQETSFRDGAASISYAAKELAEELTISLREPKVLVMGVGEIGKDVCLNLGNSRLCNVKIINRTFAKAEELAAKTGFEAIEFENLAQEIGKADVVISSVAGKVPIVNAKLLEKSGILSHKFFIDLSIPRSVDQSLELIPGIVIYNIDDLKEKTTEAVEKRKASIPAVRIIIDEAIADFNDWSKEMVISPVIQKLKNALEQLRQEELARYVKQTSGKEAERLEGFSKSLVQKIMKLPVLQLKAACRRGDPENLIEVLQELFDLEKSQSKKNSE
jgi:glutamyl-tRNA reductase